MQLSMFNFPIEDYPSQGSTLVFNLFTKRFAVFPSKAYGAHRPMFSSDLAKVALQSGVVVANQSREFDDFARWYNEKINKVDTLDITILLTYACNAACVYCYENDVSRATSMSRDVGVQTIEWIRRYASERGLSKVDVCFHGGEPFRNYGVMVQLGEALRRAFGRSLALSIVTNGSLVTKKSARVLMNLGVSTWQVTLDGLGENHNRSRPIPDQDAFACITGNLRYLRDVDRLSVNVNVGMSNASTIEADLLGLITQDYLPANARIVLSLVRNLSATGRWQLPPREAAKVIGRLISLLSQHGHHYAVDDSLPSAMCAALHPHAFVVSPTGVLRQCISAVERDFAAVGNVGDSQKIIPQSPLSLAAMRKWHTKPCSNCRYLPICMGRCGFERMAGYALYNCRRIYYDILCNMLVRLKFQSRLRDMLEG